MRVSIRPQRDADGQSHDMRTGPGRGPDPRAVAVAVAVAVGFALIAVFVDQPTRGPLLQAATYVLAWRVVILVYTGRPRSPFVLAGLALAGGIWIGDWWAVSLASGNLALWAVFGARNDLPEGEVTRQRAFQFAIAESALLALGVAAGRV